MLGLALVAFTVASWATLGPAGRAAILLAATAAVLYPVPLAGGAGRPPSRSPPSGWC
jgi:hypothetical protein